MMADWNAVSAFMANVVAWPVSPQDPGYVNLHHSYVDKDNPSGPLKKNGGTPFRSVDKFVERCGWVVNSPVTSTKDLWFCLSLQSECRPNKKYPSRPALAVRLAKNALAVKSLWIDLDVVDPANPGKTDVNKYSTLADAIKAAVKFQVDNKLPPFSAMVASGNGLHVYWISKEALTPQEWRPYAEGLKVMIANSGLMCDAGITTDIARILRVPGTKNHKDRNNPKDVTLLAQPLVMYDFQQDLSSLPGLAPAGVASQPAAKAEFDPFFDEAARLNFQGAKPAFIINDGSTLSAGIDKYENRLVEIKPIFEQCGFYKHALATGGADYDNALWMYSVLGATFMENGNAVAHAISKGHASYSEADTQALYDRKLAERADRGLGYPSCATIAGAGCKSCATCPLLSQGKSPLNIRPVVTAAVRAALNMTPPQHNQSQTGKLLSLPEGYDVDENGIICEVEQVTVGGEPGPPIFHQLFYSKLSNPFTTRNPDCIHFTTTVDMGNTNDATIRHDEMDSVGLTRAWGKNHVKIFPRNKARLEHFMMSWLANLHKLSAAQDTVPFGWFKQGNNFRGFVYGGRIMLDDGTELPCGVGDAQLSRIFKPTPHAELQHWFDALKTVTAQKRPELEAIVLLSFSAPLTALVGKNAMTLCAYGDSGAGKTAAYSVGIAVWGDPLKGKATSHSTFNSVMRKMGELSNLPFYWDEIKDTKAQTAVYDYLYNASDGTEKDRMLNGQDMQGKGTWATQMMMAANISFTDFILKKDPTHVAGLSRVLEYFVEKRDTGPGRLSDTEASLILDKLKTSYGAMGLNYGKLLAMNHAAIQQDCLDTCTKVEQELGYSAEERFWVALVGTLLVAARLANQLGCDFDEPALKAFLYDVFRQNRAKRNALGTVGSNRAQNVETAMSGYFGHVDAQKCAIWTDGMPAASRGAPESVTVIHGVPDQRNTQMTTNVAVRWDVRNQTLYILKRHLEEYLTENNVGYGTIMAALEKDWGMEVRKRGNLGAGTMYDVGRNTLCVFEGVGPGHIWANLMYRYSPDRPPTGTTPTPPTPLQTGITEAAPSAPVDRNGLTTPQAMAAFMAGATARA